MVPEKISELIIAHSCPHEVDAKYTFSLALFVVLNSLQSGKKTAVLCHLYACYQEITLVMLKIHLC